MSPCIHHPAQAPDFKCMGCRMARGAPATSYFNYSDQRCYYPVEPPRTPMSPASSLGESDEESYLLRMRFALQEMDTQIEFVTGESFLDLGCCPGGFSTYVLNKLPRISGQGVSLPVEQGGHSLAIPAELVSRFRIHWGDITSFNHAPEHSGSGRLIGRPNFPVLPDSFDLVLADGHMSPDLMNVRPGHRFTRDMLLVSQILAAVRAVRSGGTLLVKLSLSFTTQTLDGLIDRLVLALDQLSNTPLAALKPKSIYATQGTFYVLVRGVEAVPRRILELALESIWLKLVEGGKIDAQALNRLVPRNKTIQGQGWLREFLEPVKEIKRAAELRM